MNEHRLRKLSGNDEFTVWAYDARDEKNPEMGNVVRHTPGALSAPVKHGDAVYVLSNDRTTHHWAQWNNELKAIVLCLFE